MKKTRIGLFLLMTFIFCCFASIQAKESLTQSTETTLAGLADMFRQNFSSSQALGKPVDAGDYIIIPVVCRVAGFGFGTKLEGFEKEKGIPTDGKVENKQKDRIGIGGGCITRPVALIFVKKGGDFQVVKVNEGFFTELAKRMVPAMMGMIKDVARKMMKMHRKKLGARKGRQMHEDRIIFKKKKAEAIKKMKKALPKKP
jgi:uncharacterized spore protein YtfJ